MPGFARIGVCSCHFSIAVSTRLFSAQTLVVYNNVHNGWFLIKSVLMESPERDLSIGTGFVKSKPGSAKLWADKVCSPDRGLDPINYVLHKMTDLVGAPGCSNC